MGVTNFSASKSLVTCNLKTGTLNANAVNVLRNLFVNGELVRTPFDYNQIHAISSLIPNSFTVIELSPQEADIVVPANPLTTPDWTLTGNFSLITPGLGIPNPRPSLTWLNVFIPNTGTYELHFSAERSIFLPGGIWAGAVDGVSIGPGIDFSIPSVALPGFERDTSFPLGMIDAGIHSIGLVNIGNGINAGGGTRLDLYGVLRLVEVA